MARAIDADRLIEWFTPYLHTGEPIPPDVVIEDIQAMPTLTQPNGWISVKDRLPEKNVDVLCWYEYFRYGDYNRLYRTFGIGYCTNGYWGGEVSNGAQCRVLYWMPLPDLPESRPPEGEEDT